MSTGTLADVDYDDTAGLIHFLNRLQHPLMPLSSEAEIESFLDQSQEVKETTGFLKKENVPLGHYYDRLQFKTRVLVFIFDKEEYATELKVIRDTARLLAARVSVRVGLVTDPKLIRLYKARNGNHWFNDEVQLSSVVLQRFDDQYFTYDVFRVETI